MEINLIEFQESWKISVIYIVILVLLLYSIDLGFWYLKKYVKWKKLN